MSPSNSDPDGDSIVLDSVVTAPKNGTAVADFQGDVILYTPKAGFAGSDSFTYKIRDNQGAVSNVATVVVNVVAANQAPVALADSYSTPMNMELFIYAPGVLVNDSDPKNGPLTAELVTLPSQGGSVELMGNGSFYYQPPWNFQGFDTFTYRVRDSSGNLSGSATVTIEVGILP